MGNFLGREYFLKRQLREKEDELDNLKKKLSRQEASTPKIMPIPVSQLSDDSASTIRALREHVLRAFAIPPETLGIANPSHVGGRPVMCHLQLYEHVEAIPSSWDSSLFKVLSIESFEGPPPKNWDIYDSLAHIRARLAIFPLEEIVVAELRTGHMAAEKLASGESPHNLVGRLLLLKPLRRNGDDGRSQYVLARPINFTEAAIAVSERDLS